MIRMLLIMGRREASLIRPHLAPLLKEGGSSYETHHSVVGNHGSDPAVGKWGGFSRHQDRWPRSGHFEGDQRGRQPLGQWRRRCAFRPGWYRQPAWRGGQGLGPW